jgi:hypothetical protein
MHNGRRLVPPPVRPIAVRGRSPRLTLRPEASPGTFGAQGLISRPTTVVLTPPSV